MDPIGDWHVLWAHGNPYGINPTSNKFIGAKDVLDILIRNGWKEGQPIILYSCNTGNAEMARKDGNRAPLLAKELSRLSKSKVTAPNGYMAVPNGQLYGVWDGVLVPDTHEITPTHRKQWVIFDEK